VAIQATFLQIKLWKSKLEGEMHPDIKIQVNNDKSTWGSSSTILHPLSEVRGRKFCLNGQQAWFVDHLRNISSDKT